MANTRTKGKVLDENNQPIAGIKVRAFALNSFSDDFSLESAVPDQAAGAFSIDYPARYYQWIKPNPDIVVKAFDSVGRLLFESEVFPDVSDDTLDVEARKGVIIIPKDDAGGFRVTLRKGYYSSSPPPSPAEAYPLLSLTNLVKPLIDGDTITVKFTD